MRDVVRVIDQEAFLRYVLHLIDVLDKKNEKDVPLNSLKIYFSDVLSRGLEVKIADRGFIWPSVWRCEFP